MLRIYIVFITLGIALGIFISNFVLTDTLRFIFSNQAGKSYPYQVLRIILPIFTLQHFCLLILWLKNKLCFHNLLQSFNQKFSILYATPLLSWIYLSNGEAKAPLFTILLIVIILTILIRWLICNNYFQFFQRIIIGHKISFMILAFLVLIFSSFFAKSTIQNTYALLFPSFDLAIYHNVIWQAAHGWFLYSPLAPAGHLGEHFDPIVLLLALLYKPFQHVDSLLILQSIFLVSTVVPLYLLSCNLVKNALFSLTLCLSFLIHPALHGMVYYEFHSLVFATPLLIWVLYFTETNRNKLFALSFFLCLTAREDVPLLMTGFCLYLFIEKKLYTKASISLLCALLYVAIAKFFFMHDWHLIMRGAHTTSYQTWFRDIIPYDGQGALEFAMVFITNPVFVLKNALSQEKILYFLLMFTPVAFITLFARNSLFLLAYGLVFSFGSSRSLVYSVFTQYSTFLLAFTYGLVPYGVIRLRNCINLIFPHNFNLNRYLISICTLLILTSSLLITSLFGGIVPNNYFAIAGYRQPLHFQTKLSSETALLEATEIDQVNKLIPKSELLCSDRWALPFVADRHSVTMSINDKTCKYIIIHRNSEKALSINKDLYSVAFKNRYILYKFKTE